MATATPTKRMLRTNEIVALSPGCKHYYYHTAKPGREHLDLTSSDTKPHFFPSAQSYYDADLPQAFAVMGARSEEVIPYNKSPSYIKAHPRAMLNVVLDQDKLTRLYAAIVLPDLPTHLYMDMDKKMERARACVKKLGEMSCEEKEEEEGKEKEEKGDSEKQNTKKKKREASAQRKKWLKDLAPLLEMCKREEQLSPLDVGHIYATVMHILLRVYWASQGIPAPYKRLPEEDKLVLSACTEKKMSLHIHLPAAAFATQALLHDFMLEGFLPWLSTQAGSKPKSGGVQRVGREARPHRGPLGVQQKQALPPALLRQAHEEELAGAHVHQRLPRAL